MRSMKWLGHRNQKRMQSNRNRRRLTFSEPYLRHGLIIEPLESRLNLAPVILGIEPSEGVTTDLFDVAQGTVVTASSPMFPNFDARAAFGYFAPQALEPTRAIFRDQSPIAIDYIDFQTAEPIDLGSYVLTLGSNTAVPGENRWAKAFRLFGSSDPGDVQSHLLSTVTIDGPYVATYDSDTLRISDEVNALSVQYFRMEVERGTFTGFSGTRVIELDGYAIPDPSPFVESINRTTPSDPTTNATSVSYTATFSEPVTGVDPTDFVLDLTGTVVGTVTQVTPVSGNVYTVVVSGITGDGTLGLNLLSDGSIVDLSSNVLSTGYAGPLYSIDQTPPTVVSINRTTPEEELTNASSLVYTVTFSEPVTGVDPSDFAVALTGSVTYDSFVVAGSGAVYTVTFQGVSGDGTLGLNLVNEGACDYGMNYFSFFAQQAGSTSTMDDLVVRDLDTGGIVYSNSFDLGLDGLRTWFKSDGDEPWTNSSPMVRIENGQLRLESTGFLQNGAGGYNSHAAVELEQKLPDNFELSFVTQRLQWAGHSDMHFFADLFEPPERDPILHRTAGTRFEGSWGWDIETANPPHASQVIVVNALNLTNVKFVKQGDALSYYINGGLVDTATLECVPEPTSPAIAGISIQDAATNVLDAGFDGQSYTIDQTPPVVQSISREPAFRATLDFDSAVPGTLLDVTGQGTGFTHRLPGTGSAFPANDPNWDLSSSPGKLLLTSTHADFNGSNNLPNLEAPGFFVPDVNAQDVVVSAILGNIHIPNGSDQITLYAAANANATVRAGVHEGNVFIFAVNDGSGDVNTFTSPNAFATGDTIELRLIRNAGLWSLSWYNLTTETSGSLPGAAVPWLDAEPNLYFGVHASNPGSFQSFVAEIDMFAVVVESAATSTNASTVNYLVTFSEPIDGVDTTDFTLALTGTAGGTISQVTPISNSVYTVTISGITGDGTLGLDLVNDGSIQDAASNALAGNFAGDTYTIDQTAPSVVSIDRTVPATECTNATSVTYTVTFTEPVTGVDLGEHPYSAPGVQWTVENGGNGHYYEVISVPGGISWADAKVAAELSGGYLATITSQEENDFIYSLVDSALYWSGPFGGVSIPGPWLGGFHTATGIPTDWQWVTGEPFTYTNWFPGEPNYIVSLGQTQNALAFYGEGSSLNDRTSMWDDDWNFSSHQTSYVIERTSTPTDFVPVLTGSVTYDSYFVAGSGSGYTVTFEGVAGDGTLGLNLANDGSITDLATNPLGSEFTGQVYAIDQTAPFVQSIIRTTPAGPNTNASSLIYTVTFSEPVSGVDPTDFALSTSGAFLAGLTQVVPVSSSIYTVTLSVSGNGTLGLTLVNDGSIADLAGNDLDAGLAGPSYTIDQIAPLVNSIDRTSPTGPDTSATSVTYTVTFSESVEGVDATDFTLSLTGDVAMESLAVSGSGATYMVTVNGITGAGTLGLNLVNDGSVLDAATNPLSAGFVGQVYNIFDTTAPSVVTINRAGVPIGAPSYSQYFSLDYSDPFGTNPYSVSNAYIRREAFGPHIQYWQPATPNAWSEVVYRFEVGFPIEAASTFMTVTAYTVGQPDANFDNNAQSYIDVSPDGINYTNVIGAYPGHASGYDTISSSPNLDGDISSIVAGSSTIFIRARQFMSRNYFGFNASQFLRSAPGPSSFYVIASGAPETTAPASETTNASSVGYAVTFSEPVTGVDPTDFALALTGSVGGTVTQVTPISSSVYSVLVSGITGDGTLGLNLIGDGSIQDTSLNPLAGNFTGETYTIDQTAPIVQSISRTTPGGPNTNATSVTYTVAFSEAVSGVDQSDFTLALSGSVTAGISQVSAITDSIYEVTVNGIAGDGTLGLNLLNDGTIRDLATNLLVGGFEGETYTILPSSIVVGRHIFYNDSAFDGNSPGIDALDDSAIAIDKVALQFSGATTAPISAFTSYSRGINGVMVDVKDAAGTLTLADFTFKIGTNSTVSSWGTAPTPTGFSVRAGAGVDGSDRVVIVWANNAIQNAWLQVIVAGNDALGEHNTNTGLNSSDVFFFGNKIGDTFLGSPVRIVSTAATDQLTVRNNGGILQPITNIYDFDRNHTVNADDELTARNNAGILTRQLTWNPPAGPLATDGGDDSGTAVASAVATRSDGGLDQRIPLITYFNHLQVAERYISEIDEYFRESMIEDAPVARKTKKYSSKTDESLRIDDELLEALVVAR